MKANAKFLSRKPCSNTSRSLWFTLWEYDPHGDLFVIDRSYMGFYILDVLWDEIEDSQREGNPARAIVVSHKDHDPNQVINAAHELHLIAKNCGPDRQAEAGSERYWSDCLFVDAQEIKEDDQYYFNRGEYCKRNARRMWKRHLYEVRRHAKTFQLVENRAHGTAISLAAMWLEREHFAEMELARI